MIEGMTLHSAFGFDFGNKHYSLSDKVRDQKKRDFRNLKLLEIDEVSMVKSDLFYQLDLRLQEIMEKPGVPFGGVSILLFGDMLQLRPVLGRYIFEPPKNSSYQATFHLESRWEMMNIINLEINHRQGKFREFADMLNRIRVGEQTGDDLSKLQERVRPRGHPDLESVSLYIVCKKKECAMINTAYISKLQGEEFVIKGRHFLPTQKKFTPYICHKEGTVGNTSFMDKLILKIGCKVILIHNIDTSDGLTNGQLGKLMHVVKNENGVPVKLIIEFDNENAGVKNRKNNSHLLSKFPNGTLIEKVSVSYQLTRKSSKRSGNPTLIQFPIKLAQAITAHKIQGQSIRMPTKVGLDLASVFENSQAYVMLSRVEAIEQIYILDELNEEKIRPNYSALRELKLMNNRCQNVSPISWKQNSQDQFKIAHLNCMNMLNNLEDIKCDPTLMESDLLFLSETWLTDDYSPAINFYTAHYNNFGSGKGLAAFFKKEKFTHICDVQEDRMQLIKMGSNKLDVICLYRSSNGNLTTLLEHLKHLIPLNKTTLICGDFNICYIASRNNKVTKWLEDNRFKQLVQEPTHTKGRLIDHYYVRTCKEVPLVTDLLRYSPYYSDHDATCGTIKFKVIHLFSLDSCLFMLNHLI